MGVTHGIVTPEILVGNHAAKRGVELELGHVRLSALEHDFLAIALKLEDAEGGGVTFIVGDVGLVEALDMGAGGLEFDLVFEAIDFAEDGAFFELDGGFGEIGLGLAKV
jgi:hypothetical protein